MIKKCKQRAKKYFCSLVSFKDQTLVQGNKPMSIKSFYNSNKKKNQLKYSKTGDYNKTRCLSPLNRFKELLVTFQDPSDVQKLQNKISLHVSNPIMLPLSINDV